MLKVLVCVGLGGAVGAIGRYLTGIAMFRLFGGGWPWGTLTVNVLGAFLMGILVELLALRFNLSLPVQAFLTVGLLGGFTTFSAFSLETVLMIERHQWAPALVYVVLSVVLSVSALIAGLFLIRYFSH